jgi:hypothetical protein
MVTSKYIGNCTKCNLILCEKDTQQAGNAPICPRCSNHDEPGPFVMEDSEMNFINIKNGTKNNS